MKIYFIVKITKILIISNNNIEITKNTMKIMIEIIKIHF